MDTSSFSARTRTAHALKRIISNSMHHMPRSNTRCGWQNTLRRPSPAHSNAPPSRDTLNFIWVLITSAERLCSARERRKLGYVGGLKTICRIRMNYKVEERWLWTLEHVQIRQFYKGG